jgi:pimeloyl-ACP methyl ester carboxylesterase
MHKHRGNADTLLGTLVSEQAYQASWNIAVTASATAAVACIPTWATDFRADLPKIDVPMLVIQGDADSVLPIDKTGRRLPGLLKDGRLVVIQGGPHAIPWTHADQVNTALSRSTTWPTTWSRGPRSWRTAAPAGNSAQRCPGGQAARSA